MVKRFVCVGEAVDAWIREEDLAVKSGLRPVKRFDELRIDDPVEAEAYWDFIGWFLGRDYAALECIKVDRGWFVPVDGDDAISHAFGSADFIDELPEFNKYGYRLRKVFERVKVLAITHSCASSEVGRKNMFGRYKALVESEFRDEAVRIVEALKGYGAWMDKDRAVARVDELNKCIRKCRLVWDKFSGG